jgi:hypothetical protein
VRVWESARGASYEQARALGGQFGRSEVIEVQASGSSAQPAPLIGLQSFHLNLGLPQFAVGTIEFVEHQPGGILVWSVSGAPGFKYSIEKSQQVGGQTIWEPFVVVTNTTGTVTFTDTANSGSSVVFYRSRILD